MPKYILGMWLLTVVGCKFPGEPEIRADFLVGNIRVLERRNDTIPFMPDLSETEREWFYWNFGISNIAGCNLTFQFTLNNQVTSFGDASSTNGKTFAQWAESMESIQLSSTLEFPYANVLGTPLTTENARELGSNMVRSIPIYLDTTTESNRTMNNPRV